MIDLEFIDASNAIVKYRASVHVTGKLGFNKECIEYMGLSLPKFYKVGFKKDQANKTEEFYLLESDEDEIAAKLQSAGGYFYLNMGQAFKKIGLDYKNCAITYLVEKQQDKINGKDLFLLTKYKSNTRTEASKGDPLEDGVSNAIDGNEE